MAEDSQLISGGSPNILIRAGWFLLVGWELTALWLSIAWLLNISIIGLPIGLKMINWTPKVLTLKDIEKEKRVESGEITITGPKQRNMLLRAVYFLVIGWWLSLIWMIMGYLLSISIIGLPFGIWMLNRLPEVTTLYRSN
ncbi:MAG: uncharacterized membrane protein YccF (DUF307 family) [Candidatus Nanohaloarchaea archaeon]|jgi:uncharacterized membrane protein YccF (DUF307 family)